MRKILPEALSLIKESEGLQLTAYICPAGKPTIGYGHTGPDVTKADVKNKKTISQDEADALLAKDLEKVEAGVDRMVTQHISDRQFSAMVSFAYNLGLGALNRSTLLDFVNTKRYYDAANEFSRWTYVNGAVSNGLKKRRAAERALFEKP